MKTVKLEYLSNEDLQVIKDYYESRKNNIEQNNLNENCEEILIQDVYLGLYKDKNTKNTSNLKNNYLEDSAKVNSTTKNKTENNNLSNNNNKANKSEKLNNISLKDKLNEEKSSIEYVNPHTAVIVKKPEIIKDKIMQQDKSSNNLNDKMIPSFIKHKRMHK